MFSKRKKKTTKNCYEKNAPHRKRDPEESGAVKL